MNYGSVSTCGYDGFKAEFQEVLLILTHIGKKMFYVQFSLLVDLADSGELFDIVDGLGEGHTIL